MTSYTNGPNHKTNGPSHRDMTMLSRYFSCCEAFLCVSSDLDDNHKHLDHSFLDDEDEIENRPAKPSSPIVRSKMSDEIIDEGKQASHDVDDLDKMLEDMDVDKGFDALMAESQDDHDATQPNSEEEEKTDWDERLSRDEVFSDKYRLSLTETREIGRLQETLGIGSSSASRRSLLSVMSKTKQKYTAEQVKAWTHVTQGSVLMKRGSGNIKITDGTTDDDTTTTKECQICIFTKGISFFTLAKSDPLLQSLGWDNVSRIVPNDTDDTVRVETAAGKDIVLENAIGDWKDAISSCILRYMERTDTKRISTLGWQHLIVYTPGFSEAVSNDTVTINPSMVQDEYNQLTPLLYAVKLDHVRAAESLLHDFSANANQAGDDGTVPLYWADSDEMKELLLKFGAKDGQRHELFDNVDVAQVKVDQQRQQQLEAEAAKSTMQDNMNLMNERGQKIEEMANKAQELNDNAAEYKDLTGQLKSKLKERSGRWGLF